MSKRVQEREEKREGGKGENKGGIERGRAREGAIKKNLRENKLF